MCNDCFKLKHLFLLSLDLVDILVKNVDELGSEHHVRTHINEPPCFTYVSYLCFTYWCSTELIIYNWIMFLYYYETLCYTVLCYTIGLCSIMLRPGSGPSSHNMLAFSWIISVWIIIIQNERYLKFVWIIVFEIACALNLLLPKIIWVQVHLWSDQIKFFSLKRNWMHWW